MIEWDVHYDWILDKREGLLAWSNHNFSAKSSYMILNKEWNNTIKVNITGIRKSVFHEVCEMMLYPLRYLGECRFLTNSEIDPEVHRVIRTLENVVFEKRLTEKEAR